MRQFSGQTPTHILPQGLGRILSPEKSPELSTLTEGVVTRFSQVYHQNISEQMRNLLGSLPFFNSIISRSYKICEAQIYHFLVSRGYETLPLNDDEKKAYKLAVAEFIERGQSLGAKIDSDIYVETDIISGEPRGNITYKFYQTFDENRWKECIAKLPELYSMIAREMKDVENEKIGAKFPGYAHIFRERCDNLVIYCRNKESLPVIQKIVEDWIQKYSIPAKNRPFYRSSFGVDAPHKPGESKTSFSDLCAKLSNDYVKQINEWNKKKNGADLSNSDYNILAIGQACMYASTDPQGIAYKTKR